MRYNLGVVRLHMEPVTVDLTEVAGVSNRNRWKTRVDSLAHWRLEKASGQVKDKGQSYPDLLQKDGVVNYVKGNRQKQVNEPIIKQNNVNGWEREKSQKDLKSTNMEWSNHEDLGLVRLECSGDWGII